MATTSTNMNLEIPTIGSDPSPDWASDINSSLTIIDGHDHSPGYGIQVTPSGLNINAALPFGNNPLTGAQLLGLTAQGSDPSTLGALYYKGVDLYFNDGSGNHIRITSAGSVTGATGTITGLPSGTASASFGSATFVFQSATNTAAAIDGQSFILRNSAASSKGLTLSPPAAMAADISMVLPTIPASTQVLNMDSSGNFGTVTYNSVADNRTRATGSTVAVGGVAISSNCTLFTSSSSSYADVTNLTVTITSSSRPVYVGLVYGGTSSSFVNSGIEISNTTGTEGIQGWVAILRGSTIISQTQLETVAKFTSANTTKLQVPASAISHVDIVAGGTYTYKIQAASDTTLKVANVKLVAYEL